LVWAVGSTQPATRESEITPHAQRGFVAVNFITGAVNGGGDASPSSDGAAVSFSVALLFAVLIAMLF
jgi:hypothetical protein